MPLNAIHEKWHGNMNRQNDGDQCIKAGNAVGVCPEGNGPGKDIGTRQATAHERAGDCIRRHLQSRPLSEMRQVSPVRGCPWAFVEPLLMSGRASWWRGRSQSPRRIPTSPSRLRGGVPGARLDRESQMSKSTRSRSRPHQDGSFHARALDFIGRGWSRRQPLVELIPRAKFLPRTVSGSTRGRMNVPEHPRIREQASPRARGPRGTTRGARLGHRLYLLEPIRSWSAGDDRPRFVKRASRKLKAAGYRLSKA